VHDGKLYLILGFWGGIFEQLSLNSKRDIKREKEKEKKDPKKK
jgi:hypothetical protein